MLERREYGNYVVYGGAKFWQEADEAFEKTLKEMYSSIALKYKDPFIVSYKHRIKWNYINGQFRLMIYG